MASIAPVLVTSHSPHVCPWLLTYRSLILPRFLGIFVITPNLIHLWSAERVFFRPWFDILPEFCLFCGRTWRFIMCRILVNYKIDFLFQLSCHVRQALVKTGVHVCLHWKATHFASKYSFNHHLILSQNLKSVALNISNHRVKFCGCQLSRYRSGFKAVFTPSDLNRANCDIY